MATKLKKPARKTKAKPKAKRREKSHCPGKVTGGGPLGNQFWKLRSSHGRKPLFADGDALWAACVEYFEWVEANPLQEERIFTYEGKIIRGHVSKMRAMTLDGLCTFLDVSVQAWCNFRRRDELAETAERVDRVIRDYKFTGAAADLLNPVIIARDLGLRDGMEHTGVGGGPISGVLAVPTSPEDWAKIAQLQQHNLKHDDGS